MKKLMEALESNNIDYTTEYIDGEFIYIDTFSYKIEIFKSDIDEKYSLGTYKDNDLDADKKNEKSVKSIKAVLNYIDKFDK